MSEDQGRTHHTCKLARAPCAHAPIVRCRNREPGTAAAPGGSDGDICSCETYRRCLGVASCNTGLDACWVKLLYYVALPTHRLSS